MQGRRGIVRSQDSEAHRVARRHRNGCVGVDVPPHLTRSASRTTSWHDGRPCSSGVPYRSGSPESLRVVSPTCRRWKAYHRLGISPWLLTYPLTRSITFNTPLELADGDSLLNAITLPAAIRFIVWVALEASPFVATTSSTVELQASKAPAGTVTDTISANAAGGGAGRRQPGDSEALGVHASLPGAVPEADRRTLRPGRDCCGHRRHLGGPGVRGPALRLPAVHCFRRDRVQGNGGREREPQAGHTGAGRQVTGGARPTLFHRACGGWELAV